MHVAAFVDVVTVVVVVVSVAVVVAQSGSGSLVPPGLVDVRLFRVRHVVWNSVFNAFEHVNRLSLLMTRIVCVCVCVGSWIWNVF